MCLNECTKHSGNVKIKLTNFHLKKKGKKEKKKERKKYEIYNF